MLINMLIEGTRQGNISINRAVWKAKLLELLLYENFA